MLNNIDKRLIGWRTTEFINIVYRNHAKYRSLTPHIVRLLNSVNKALPTEQRGLLEELEDYQNKRESVLFEALYRQGLIDGLRLANLPNKGKSKSKRNKW